MSLNRSNKLKLVLQRMKDNGYTPDKEGLAHIERVMVELKDDDEFYDELDKLTKDLQENK